MEALTKEPSLCAGETMQGRSLAWRLPCDSDIPVFLLPASRTAELAGTAAGSPCRDSCLPRGLLCRVCTALSRAGAPVQEAFYSSRPISVLSLLL